ncbi:V-type proton ATPase subunit G 3 isoform X2 [Myotis daubentonii]|uniref:V-type proton ATPase subunit G 3 isoform X2 n=1 Tax=Myotis daubentonii TaxID=98922 RepID=UPI0028730C4F|nr:V-type proton ATPase subunit G 3 isoform X2 [Myotis daubentonii]
MASQSQGIHQLLQAERRAKDKLEEAKKSHGLAEQPGGGDGGAGAGEDHGADGELPPLPGGRAGAGAEPGLRCEAGAAPELQSRRLKPGPRLHGSVKGSCKSPAGSWLPVLWDF